MQKKQKQNEQYSTISASRNLVSAMEEAIQNMTEELRKKPDGELSGSQRRSELQSYKEVAIACKELIVEREKLIQYAKDLEEGSDGLDEKNDWSGGFAEKFAKK